MNKIMKKHWICLLWAISLLLTAVQPAEAQTLRQVVVEETGSSIFPSRFMQAEGQAHVLVIPVEFTDYQFSEDPVETLEEIFWGSGGTKTPSLTDYFARASYGELTISGEVQPVVALHGTRQEYEGRHPDMIEELLAVLTERGVDLHQFDRNQDGILDGLYLVWAGTPGTAESAWWPYSDTFYWDFTTSGIQVGSYSSLSYELLTSSAAFRQYTAIHETGHQLGLTDYYASAYESGTSATVMMDRNEGDEDCFSKLILGWVEPEVVTDSQIITLGSASVHPEAAVILPSSWNGNYLSEYFMAEYVTPEANQSNQPLSPQGAVRIWHVNAATSRWTDDITSSMYRYRNSGSGPKLLTVVDADQEWYTAGAQIAEEQMLLYSGEETGIAIYVDSLSGSEARLRITYFGQEPAEPETSSGLSGPAYSGQESANSTDLAAESSQEESSLPADSSGEGAETSDEEGSIESDGEETEGTPDEENSDENVLGEEGEEPETEHAENSESAEAAEKKPVPPVVPVVFVIGLGALLCYLALSDKKKKHKKKKKRKR